MRLGFTLVELSIVLVIIGLLIGGILVGQSLIESAGISSTVMQVQQFDAATIGFKQKYKYLPGDVPGFCGSCAPDSKGDGNGVIVHRTDINQAVLFVGEIANFWSNLFPTKYSSCNNDSTNPCPVRISGTNKNAPTAKIGAKGSFFIASGISWDGYTGSLVAKQNYFALLNSSNKTGTFLVTNTHNASLSVRDMLALENKMDDGRANAGNLISGGIGFGGAANSGGAIVPQPWYQCSAPGSTATAVYDVNDADFGCTPLFRIGAQASHKL